ncbi:MAG: beta-N-acetylhexosaminidase [Rhodospirillales bacterium]
MQPRACVLGVSGTRLGDREAALMADLNPLGFILFAYNVVDPVQVGRLVSDLRAAVGRPDAPILIDQEGGRVRRLRPPHWFDAPSAKALGAARDPLRANWLSARLIADDLSALGITVNCAPVLDVPQPGADPIIGDRAHGEDPVAITDRARAYAAGLTAGGVSPVIKHIPGHGRAEADSHKALPVVKADRAALESIDFPPFLDLRDAPWAMTAHVVYEAFDKAAPATTSKRVIEEVIRGICGFDGLLISDDLAMQALSGSLEERAEAVLAAGCDLVLYCNNERAPLETVESVARHCPALSEAAEHRWRLAEAKRGVAGPFDCAGALAELQGLLED